MELSANLLESLEALGSFPLDECVACKDVYTPRKSNIESENKPSFPKGKDPLPAITFQGVR